MYSFSCLYGHRAVSVRDGAFFSDSVWAGNVQPDLRSDSIFVSHYLNFYQNITLTGTGYMFISPRGTLCGRHSFNVLDTSSLWVRGSLYFDSLLVESTLISNGYIDGLAMDIEPPAGYLYDSCGVIYIHSSPQLCAADSFLLVVEVDTALTIRQDDNVVSLSFDPTLCGEININFGDNDSTRTNGFNSVTHIYAHSGTYIITVNSYCIACGDTAYSTQYRTIVIDSVCNTPASFLVYPDPCDAYFYVRYESCQAGSYTSPIYDDIGQIVREVSFDNTGTPAKVESDDLASGIYFIKIPDQRNYKPGAKKIVVVH